MTAIANFTLPNLDSPSGSASRPALSSSEPRLKAAGAESPGVASKDNNKEFGELLNTRVVKKETGKQGNFDRSGQTATEAAENSTEIEDSGLEPADSHQGTAHQATESNSERGSAVFGISLSADSILVGTGTKTAGDGEPGTRPVPELTDSGFLRITGKPGETADKSGPAGSPNPLAVSQATRSDSLSQVRVAAPAPADDRPIAADPNADRTLDSRVHSGLSSSDESETLSAGTARQKQPVLTTFPAGSNRSIGWQGSDSLSRADDGTAEVAAPGGRQLPDSGKSLPSVLLDTPARFSRGLSDRTDLMTRSVERARQHSTGKDIGELPILEKAGLANNRLPVTELLGRAVNPVHGNTSTEAGTQGQASGSDTQATGLLAQHLAGVERTANPRNPTALTGLDSNNTFTLQLQPGSQEVSAQLGSRIRWMNNLNISSAEVKLYPAELGTLEIMITAEDDQARVNFITSTTAARDMIEASMPRLRELLGQSGLLLQQGDVTHRDPGQSQSQSHPGGTVSILETPVTETMGSGTTEQLTPLYQRTASDSRIDHFA